MHDNADPLNGWSVEEVERTSTGPATSDIYGKLFYYLRSLLNAFLNRISSSNVAFELLQMDVAELPRHLEGRFFDRIEVGCHNKRQLMFINPALLVY